MTSNPVGWFEIYVQDMNRARQFYEAVFSVQLQKLDAPGIQMWAFPMGDGLSGTSGALVRVEGVASGGNSSILYFSCVDCATEASRVAASGGTIFRDKFAIGQFGFVALALDTEGNMIGLHSRQ